MRSYESPRVHLLPGFASLAFHDDKIVRSASVTKRDNRAMKISPSHFTRRCDVRERRTALKNPLVDSGRVPAMFS